MTEKIPIREGTFFEDSEGVKLLANKCKSCGQVFFPKAGFCLNCLHEEMEEIVLSRRGRLYTYTVGHMPSTHFTPPYAIGFVDMPEGVRVFAPLQIFEDTPLKAGMEMEVVMDKLWEEEEKEVVGYKFKPI